MFYSHDILGRKTPLGAIWTIAHGRKLSKGRVLCINISEICLQILQPSLPHSLRLQGILVGGVTTVFYRQQDYLLEDLNEMMKKVRGLMAPANNNNTSTMLDTSKRTARFENITVPDLNNLNPYNGSYNPSILGPFTDSGLDKLEDDLFVMPAAHDEDIHKNNYGRDLDTMPMIDESLYQVPQEPYAWDPTEMFDAGTFAHGQANIEIPEFNMPDVVNNGKISHLAEEPPADQFDAMFDSMPGAHLVATEKPISRPRARKSQKKRKMTVKIDDLEAMQISSKMYRQWTLDQNDIMFMRSRLKPSSCGSNKALLMLQQWYQDMFNLLLTRNVNLKETKPPPPDPNWKLEVKNALTEEDMLLGEDFGDVERLRAAGSTPSTGQRQLQGLTPIGVRDLLISSGSRSKIVSSTSSESSLDLEMEAPAHKRAKRSLQLPNLHENDPIFGDAALEDLLPHIEEHEQAAAKSGHSPMTQEQYTRSLPRTQNQASLLEETEHNSPNDNMYSTYTHLALRVFRHHLAMLGPDKPRVICLQHLTDKLSRSEAAKLFYQVCAMQSQNYVSAVQKAPYGEIIIEMGSKK